MAVPNGQSAIFYDPFWFSISSSDSFFPMMIFEQPRTFLWWVIRSSSVLATETVHDQGRYNITDTWRMRYAELVVPILQKITVFTLEMENFKFQLNSGEISANFSYENLFFYIFPEMISSYLMVYLGRASWVNIYSTFILDRGLNSCRVTCYGPRS